MTAVTTVPGFGELALPAMRRLTPRAAPRRGRQASRTTYRRRRFAAATLASVVVVVAGQAGVALGGPPLAAPERRPAGPAPRLVIARPGDTLWSIAARVGPEEDPRPVVDALSAARHGAPLVPGEAIRWPG